MRNYRNETPAGKGESLLAVSLEMLERFGWVTFPVWERKPLLRWSLLRNGVSSQRVKGMPWRDATGLAVILGKTSGNLNSFDFDTANGYPDWKRNNPSLAKSLPTAKTRRGHHIYFRGSEHFKAFPTGEYRGDAKHFNLIPPSVHPYGGEYSWILPPYGDEIPYVGGIVDLGLGIHFSLYPHTPRESSNRIRYRVKNLEIIRNIEIERKIQRIIALHQPETEGERHFKLFHLAKSLWSLPVEWDRHQLREVFGLWWEEAGGVVGTKDYSFSLGEFLTAFDNVEAPYQINAERILKDSEYVPVPDDFAHLTGKQLILLKVCIHQQNYHCDNPFFLSGEIVGEMLGVSKVRGHALLAEMVRLGILELVRRGSNFTGRANTYFYKGG